jgi:hypothetical protein
MLWSHAVAVIYDLHTIKKLAEKENFVGSIVDGNIFGIARRIGSMLLLV